jgi:hypothetical protein
MRAETRLSGRARARAGEGQHPLQGGWLPGLTIRWSELSPARGFATCGMGAQSARSAANEYVCDKARRCINIRPGGLTGGTVTGSAVQPTSRKALDNRALTRYARRVPVGWRWGCVADRIGDLRGWPGLPAAGCAEMILWPDVVREAGDAAGDGAAIAAVAMQLSNVVKTFVLRATNVPKRTANKMAMASAKTPHFDTYFRTGAGRLSGAGARCQARAGTPCPYSRRGLGLSHTRARLARGELSCTGWPPTCGRGAGLAVLARLPRREYV